MQVLVEIGESGKQALNFFILLTFKTVPVVVGKSVVQSNYEPEFVGLNRATTDTGWKSKNLLKTGKKVLAFKNRASSSYAVGSTII
jgi:hypothetical protein